MLPLTLVPGIALSLFLALLFYLIASNRTGHPKATLPPGPKYPPAKHSGKREWHLFRDWMQEYGAVFSFPSLQTRVIVLNSKESIKDLLAKKAAWYSDRPEMKLFKDWCGWTWSVASFNDGPEMALHRRLLATGLSLQAGQYYEKDLWLGALKLAERLIRQLPRKEDGNWKEWCHLMVAGNILKVSYGYEALEDSDPWIKRVQRMQELILDLGILGTNLVDKAPLLQYVPTRMLFGSQTAKSLAELRNIFKEVFDDQYRFTLTKMESGEDSQSFIARMTQNINQYSSSPGSGRKLTRKEVLQAIQGVAATTYTAGVETIESTMNYFILAMLLYPEVQTWARNHLDAYMQERSREDDLPNFTDRGVDALVAIDALVWEVLRWEPAVPLAVSRTARQDGIYNGMFIPRGSLIMPNSWQCLHDPVRYPDPDRFDPGRFMPASDGAHNDGPRPQEDPREFAFGYGRRICPGRVFAESTLWITITTLLSLFIFESPLDELGRPIKPAPDYQFGIAVQYPEPFQFIVKARDGAERKLEGALFRAL